MSVGDIKQLHEQVNIKWFWETGKHCLTLTEHLSKKVPNKNNSLDPNL